MILLLAVIIHCIGFGFEIKIVSFFLIRYLAFLLVEVAKEQCCRREADEILSRKIGIVYFIACIIGI